MSVTAGMLVSTENGLVDQRNIGPSADQTHHTLVRSKLRYSLLNRNKDGHLRGDEARSCLHTELMGESRHLLSLPQHTDDRVSRKRGGGVGAGLGAKMGPHDGLSMAGVPGTSNNQHPHAPQHQHLHGHGAQQNRAGACDGLVCSNTMNPGGAAGLPASLCSANSAMHGTMDDRFSLNTPLGSSAPAGSYQMHGMSQHHMHSAATGQSAPAEWHSGVPAPTDAAFRSVDPYGGAPYHDMSRMDMLQGDLGAGQLHHTDATGAVPGMHQSPVGGHVPHGPTVGGGTGHPSSLPQLNPLHLDVKMQEQMMQRNAMSSVGTPTTPNHVGSVAGGLDGGYKSWYSGNNMATRTSSAVQAPGHPSVPTNDYSLYQSAAPAGGTHMAQSAQSAGALQPHQHHAQMHMQQQPQQASMMPLTPIIDDLDQVFIDSQSWPTAGGRDSTDPTVGAMGLSNLSSPPLNHDQVPNASVVPPTSYAMPQYSMANHVLQARHHSASQTPYYGNSQQVDLPHRHASTGSTLPSHAGAVGGGSRHGYADQSFQSPMHPMSQHQQQQQPQQGVQQPVMAASAVASQQQHHHGAGGMPHYSAAFDTYPATVSAQTMTPHTASQVQHQQQNSHFNFNSTGAFPAQQHMIPGASNGYNVSSASAPPSAGYMDTPSGRPPHQQQPPMSGMSLQQILSTPSTIPMPDRMPYP